MSAKLSKLHSFPVNEVWDAGLSPVSDISSVLHEFSDCWLLFCKDTWELFKYPDK